jgi:aspartate kinase
MLIVQKYGGATVASPEKIRQVAKRLQSLREQGHDVVVVVSAMGPTTNQLIELAHSVSAKPNRREMDMLLSTGERVSMALLSLALLDLQVPAISFTGSQAGILTSDSHLNAEIEEVRAPRLREALNQRKIVVLAGFQGVSPRTKEITTLGRGGSDLTAIAMAAHLRADRCEILKDVDGVYSADPRIVPGAFRRPVLNSGQLLEMTFWGAKVLHHRSVELAHRKKVSLYIGPADSRQNQEGTLMTLDPGTKMEESAVLSVNSHEGVLQIHVRAATPAEGLAKWNQILSRSEIPAPQVLHVRQQRDQCEFWVTGPAEIREALSQIHDSDWRLQPAQWCSISANCAGATGAELPPRLLHQLQDEAVEVLEMLVSPMTVSFIVPQGQREKGVRALHQLVARGSDGAGSSPKNQEPFGRT